MAHRVLVQQGRLGSDEVAVYVDAFRYSSEIILGSGDAVRYWLLRLKGNPTLESNPEGSYESAPDGEATWFIDPPYQIAESNYETSAKRGRVRSPR